MSKDGISKRTLQHPIMHKRVERKQDGRLLIYYSFTAAEARTVTERPASQHTAASRQQQVTDK
jgi:hypothetical protein